MFLMHGLVLGTFALTALVNSSAPSSSDAEAIKQTALDYIEG